MRNCKWKHHIHKKYILTNFEWIQKIVPIHPPLNVLINFNDFIEKKLKLQNIKLEGLPKMSNQQYPYQGIFDVTITYWNQTLPKHSQSIDIKTQGQTFDNLIIDLWQPLDNVHLNMHNIYVTLLCLRSIDGLIILRNITIQDICKTKFKKGFLEILEPISKHNIAKKVQFENNYPLKSYKEKDKHLIMINDSNDDNIDKNIINY